jgi:hypothetical protein
LQDSPVVTIRLPALTAAATSTQTAVQGLSSSVVVGTFVDANPDPDPSAYSATVYWGDGSNDTNATFDEISSNASSSTWEVIDSHAYSAYGSDEAYATVVDNSATSLTLPNTLVNVVDAPLTGGSNTITTVTSGVEYTTPTALTASFTDADTALRELGGQYAVDDVHVQFGVRRQRQFHHHRLEPSV